MLNELECVVDAKAQLGEGVFWHEKEQRIYWVDIDNGLIYRYDPKTAESESRSVGKKVGTAAPATSGRLVLGLEDGVYDFEFGSGTLRKWGDPLGGDPDNRFNDGKAGPDGRFYVGSLGPEGEQSLYRVEKDRSWAEIEGGITCSNGMAWSLDNKTMYYIDSPTCQVVAYDFDPERGDISNQRVVVEVTEREGFPDGMTIDSEGMLWVAHWGGACVRRWNPNTGELLREIPVPVKRVTSCAFGGADLRDLYITTASVEMQADDWDEQPQAGGLFRIRLEVAGIPGFAFEDGAEQG